MVRREFGRCTPHFPAMPGVFLIPLEAEPHEDSAEPHLIVLFQPVRTKLFHALGQLMQGKALPREHGAANDRKNRRGPLVVLGPLLLLKRGDEAHTGIL